MASRAVSSQSCASAASELATFPARGHRDGSRLGDLDDGCPNPYPAPLVAYEALICQQHLGFQSLRHLGELLTSKTPSPRSYEGLRSKLQRVERGGVKEQTFLGFC
jgi:hypothetical protein